MLVHSKVEGKGGVGGIRLASLEYNGKLVLSDPGRLASQFGVVAQSSFFVANTNLCTADEIVFCAARSIRLPGVPSNSSSVTSPS